MQLLKNDRTIKLIKDFDKLKELNLNFEENSIMAYIEKSELIKKIIKEELNFDKRKYLEFI